MESIIEQAFLDHFRPLINHLQASIQPTQRLDDLGYLFFLEAEGSERLAYKNGAGFLTIGIGHKLTQSELTSGKIILDGEKVKWRDGLSDEQIRALFNQDIREREKIVNTAVQVPLSQHQFNALVSFAYNIGEHAFRRSTLVKKLNNRDFQAIPGELRRWVYAGGKKILTSRREKEVDMWLGAWTP